MFTKYYNNKWEYYPKRDYYNRNYYDYSRQIIDSQISNVNQNMVNYGFMQNVNQTANSYNIK